MKQIFKTDIMLTTGESGLLLRTGFPVQ